MVSLLSLWLPIVLAAVVVFLASAVLHMVLTYHRSDFRQLPNEDKVVAPIRDERVPPGDYFFPYCMDQKEMNDPAVKKRFEEGPVGVMTVMPSGLPNMGKNLSQWFVFCLVVSVFVAYLASITLASGTSYLTVFRVAGTAAFLAYSAAYAADSIWMGKSWGTTAKQTLDGLIYALLTGGVFGWLWPA